MRKLKLVAVKLLMNKIKIKKKKICYERVILWNIRIYIYTLYITVFDPIVDGRGGGVNLPPPSDFLNNFFFTQAKSLKFSDFEFLFFRHNMAKFH